MKQSKKGIKYIGYLVTRYLPMLIIIILMSGIDSATYTYVCLLYTSDAADE